MRSYRNATAVLNYTLRLKQIKNIRTLKKKKKKTEVDENKKFETSEFSEK